jgi:hypothetical protein
MVVPGVRVTLATLANHLCAPLGGFPGLSQIERAGNAIVGRCGNGPETIWQRSADDAVVAMMLASNEL